MPDYFFVNTKTGRKYKVVQFNEGTVTLAGESGVQFTEKFSKELFKNLGYELTQA